MIRYSEGIHLLLQFKGSVCPKAFLFSLPSVLLAVLLIYFADQAEEEFVSSNIAVDLSKGQVWTALTGSLSLLISFRTSQSLTRFWEGTGLLHQMRGEWFDSASCLMSFSRHAKSIRPEEVIQFRQTLIRLCSLMHGSALDDISGNSEDSYETIDVLGLDTGTLRFLRDCKVKYGWNKVCALQHMIQVLITHNLRIGVLDIPPPILSRVYQTLSRGFVNLLNAVKIKDTNFPFPWAQMIYLLLVIHSLFTPLIVTSFTSSYQWAIPVTFLPVFGMFALNQVAAQLEMPFGTDDNDLPLTHFQWEFNRSLLLLTHEMSDHLPATQTNSKTSVEDLSSFLGVPGASQLPGASERDKAYRKSSSKVFETMNFDDDPEIMMIEVPKLEEKAFEKKDRLMPLEKDQDDWPVFNGVEKGTYVYGEKLHEAEVVEIVAMCKESLTLLSQALPAALQQHCEAISKLTETVPYLLQHSGQSSARNPHSLPQREVSSQSEGVRSV